MVDEKITNPTLTEKDIVRLQRKCQLEGYSTYVKRNPSLEKETERKFHLDPMFMIKKRRTSLREIRRIVGREHVVSLLNKDYSQLQSLVDMFFSFIEKYVTLEIPLIEHRKRTKSNDNIENNINIDDDDNDDDDDDKQEKEKGEEEKNDNFIRTLNQKRIKLNRELNEKGHRKRKIWNEDEDRILLVLKRNNIGWSDISRNLKERTGVDVKDRFRNLIKKYGSEDEIYKSIIFKIMNKRMNRMNMKKKKKK